MGAAGSIGQSALVNNLPPHILLSYNNLESLKNRIANEDAYFIKLQTSKSSKDYKKLTALVAGRTKQELFRISEVFIRKEDEKGYNCKLDDELWGLVGGGLYGNFLRQLVLQKIEIVSEQISSSIGSFGLDSTLLVEAFCILTQNEIQQGITEYESKNHVVFLDKVKAKCTSDSWLIALIINISTKKRNESVSSSIHDRSKFLHNMFTSKRKAVQSTFDDPDLHECIDMLCRSSRDDCLLINKCLKEEFGITNGLQEVIESIFVGIISRGLHLWCISTKEAVVNVLQTNMSNKLNIEKFIQFISLYDKHELGGIEEEYYNIYNERLQDKLNSQFSGNFKHALLTWFTSVSYDNKLESRINRYLSIYKELLGGYGDTIPTCEGYKLDEDFYAELSTSLQQVLDIVTVFAGTYCVERDVSETTAVSQKKNFLHARSKSNIKEVHLRTNDNVIESKDEYEAQESGLSTPKKGRTFEFKYRSPATISPMKLPENYNTTSLRTKGPPPASPLLEGGATTSTILKMPPHGKPLLDLIPSKLPPLSTGDRKGGKKKKIKKHSTHDEVKNYDDVANNMQLVVVEEKSAEVEVNGVVAEGHESHEGREGEEDEEVVYDTETKAEWIYYYLQTVITTIAVDENGLVNLEQFIVLLNSLSVGYSETDIIALFEWIDTSGESKLTTDSILNALSYSLIEAIENNLGMTVQDKVNELWASYQQYVDEWVSQLIFY